MSDSVRTSRDGGATAAPHTEIKTDRDLRLVLSEIIADKGSETLLLLQQTVLGLRSELDPASVTMSSTNIPDAIIKLSAVLTDTDTASHRVFDLVDRQGKLLKQAEKELSELERLCQSSTPDSRMVAGYISRHRALNNALQSVSNEIVTSQEFQDLCGQKVKKVIRLVCDMECYIRALLAQLRIEVPTAKTAAQAEADKDIDQDSTDALLKELGF
jgi:chemotaxis protein CheZ